MPEKALLARGPGARSLWVTVLFVASDGGVLKPWRDAVRGRLSTAGLTSSSREVRLLRSTPIRKGEIFLVEDDELEVDVAVIGGGACGMMAALRTAARDPSLRVAVFEKSTRQGCQQRDLERKPSLPAVLAFQRRLA